MRVVIKNTHFQSFSKICFQSSKLLINKVHWLINFGLLLILPKPSMAAIFLSKDWRTEWKSSENI